MSHIDLSGMIFGRLEAIKPCGQDKRGQALWVCRCSCGNYTTVLASSLTSRNTQSCGCLQHDRTVNALTKHGQYGTRIYKIWVNMKFRCNNPNATCYKRYGGRGIRVCNEWNESFESFYEWAMANGYNDSLTIDRIDNDGGYNPNNCRWSTTSEQAVNKTNNIIIEYAGKTMSISQWAQQVGIKYGTLRARILEYKWPIGEALGFEPHIRR